MRESLHDVLNLGDLVADELAQLLSSGHDADAVAELQSAAVGAAERGDDQELDRLLADTELVGRRADWPYREPSDEQTLRAFILGVAASDAAARPVWSGSEAELRDRVYGAWLGRCVGNCLGKPVEGLDAGEVAGYLAAAGGEPFADYLPLLDPLPDGVPWLHESAPLATAGHFDCTPRDDDIDWSILTLHLVETYGPELATADIAAAWLDYLPFTQTFTAERAAYRNLLHGLAAPRTATWRNPYREWIGALIRADVYGYICPGRPGAAAGLALSDAVLSHVQSGIYGELWAAALVASAFTAADATDALRSAVRYVPAQTRLREALETVLALHASGTGWESAQRVLRSSFGHYSWVHTINNAASISAGLLWGGGDFTSTVALTIRAGADTDSTAATAGSVFGALHGSAAIPERLSVPLNDTIRSSVRDFDRVHIRDLADRTVRVVTGRNGIHPAAPAGGTGT